MLLGTGPEDYSEALILGLLSLLSGCLYAKTQL